MHYCASAANASTELDPLRSGHPVLFSCRIPHFQRSVGIQGSNPEPNNQIGPCRMRVGHHNSGGYDRHISYGIVAGRQGCRARQTAPVRAETRQHESTR